MDRDKFILKFLKEYDVFYRSPSRNQYIFVPPVKIYTRKSNRLFKTSIRCLDIGSITVDENFQKKGLFTAILSALIEKYPTEHFFIESILNEHVRKIADKLGFVLRNEDDDIFPGYNMYLIRN